MKDIYKVLTKIIKIRFSKELKGSGVEFTGFYFMEDLVSNNKFYLLELNDTNFRFVDEKGFLVFFIQFLKKSTYELNKLYKELVTQQIDDCTDEIAHELMYKRVYYNIDKQKQLLSKFTAYKNDKY